MTTIFSNLYAFLDERKIGYNVANRRQKPGHYFLELYINFKQYDVYLKTDSPEEFTSFVIERVNAL